MRWEYHDPADLLEARARQPISEAMDRWWEAFEHHADDLDAVFTRRGKDFDVAQFTISNLKPIDERLFWEYGSAIRKKGHRLVVTPEGVHPLRPMVQELLRRAPKLERWEFYPDRLPEPPQTALGVAEQISRFKAADLAAEVSLGRHRKVDLLFHISNCKKDEKAARRYAFCAAEQLLGSEVLDRWLGVLDLASPRTLAQKMTSRGRGNPVDVSRLKGTVDALLAASVEQLPEVPPRLEAQRENADAIPWTSFELKPPEQADYSHCRDLGFLATCEPDLAQAALTDPLFFSGRFSRTGEKFCFLKIDRDADEQGHRSVGSAEARARIEDAVNAMLAEHNLGCTFGGGSGRRYAYIFLALTDVRRAIPILRDLASKSRFNPRSWLLFFDAELQDEWLGLLANSPPPPAEKRQ